MTRSVYLAAMLPALCFGACLLDSKHSCHTIDDCAPSRVCVAGTCQAARRDAGQDTSPEKQSSVDVAIDLAERPSPDLAGGPDGAAPDGALAPPAVDVAPDAPATVDAPESPVGLDASSDKPSSGDVAADLSQTLSPDLAVDLDSASDLAPPLVDAASDTPIVAVIDAPGEPAGPDAGSDRQSTGDVATDVLGSLSPDLAGDRDSPPDLPPPVVDAAPDAPSVPTIDAPPDSSPPGSGSDASDAGSDRAGDLVQPPVSWEDFRAQSPREPWTGGRFIVDGDLVLDEAGLRRYYDAWIAAVGVSPENLAPMGATALWPFPYSFLLSYCISADFGDNLAAVEAAMQAATASWGDRVGVEYSYLPAENASCNADNTNVIFDVRPVSGAGYTAVSFFPDSPRSAQSLLVDASAFATDAGGVDLEAILRHQLGHTLGFQHEHLWLDPACTTEDSRLAVQIANYDIDSVMHLPSCRPTEIGGTIQTDGDFAGAIALYGLAPALIAITTR